jgi:hypothetical protein
MDAQAVVRLSGTKLVVESVKTFPEGPVVDRILAAITDGDRSALVTFSGGKTDIADSLAKLRVGTSGFGAVACHAQYMDAAGNTTIKPMFPTYTGLRICDVERKGSTTAYIGMGAKVTGSGDWAVLAVSPT